MLMLSHSVFFTLKESSPGNIQALVDDCHKYLKTADGIVSMYAGGRIADLDREVNDKGFDDALIVVFESREAHDAYQTVPDHLTFIERNKDSWETVRVFDANC